MKIKFLTHCRDLVTGEHYLEGAVVDLPEARAQATIDKGHAVRVTEPRVEEPRGTESKPKPGRPPKNKAAEASEDK